jgi:UDP-N-acetylmuramoyl-tripeptide--D-alanyl-D-alanine ligase
MLELGPDERALHERIGREAADVVDGLVGVGERGRWIAAGARGAGLRRVATAPDAESALEVVEQTLGPTAGDVLLVKASRGLALDRLVAALTGQPPDDHA